jgi:ABC-type sulfate/molybdate transport systems ATPase subunit
MNFLGRANALTGVAEHGVAHIHGLQFPYSQANGVALPVTGYFRPQQVRLSAGPVEGALRARIQRVVTTGLSTKVELLVEDSTDTFVAEVIDQADLEAGLVLDVGNVVYAKPSSLRVYASQALVSEPSLAEAKVD